MYRAVYVSIHVWRTPEGTRETLLPYNRRTTDESLLGWMHYTTSRDGVPCHTEEEGDDPLMPPIFVPQNAGQWYASRPGRQ